MAIISFSSMTPDEFFNMNQKEIPEFIIKYFDEQTKLNNQLAEQVKILKRSLELTEEQQYFAIELVKEIDAFAESNLSKKKLEQYNTIRDNTQFET